MNFLYYIYFSLPNFALIGVVGKVINRVLRIILKKVFDTFLPSYFKRTANKAGYGLNINPREEYYIVSLTSFPARIDEIWVSIETLLRQSFKPDKIILWLSNEQFPDNRIPERLSTLQKRGLTVEFCDQDFRSHKKYYYAMQKYPNCNIITVDDDLYYDKNLLANLVQMHSLYTNLITTNRAHKLTFKHNLLNPYRAWKHNVTDRPPSNLLVQTGGAGTLYPPNSLHPEVFNHKIFKELCFHADDLWLKVMALKHNTKIVTNNRYNKDFITITTSQNVKLVSNNVFSGGNDEQLRNVLEYYQMDIFKTLEL